MQKEIITSVSLGSVDFAATKDKVSRELYRKIEWKGSKIPKSCNLDASNLKLLDRAEDELDLNKILDNKQEAAAYAHLILYIAERCGSYLEVQLFTFSRIEELLGIGTFPGNISYGIHNAPLFMDAEGHFNHGPFVRAIESGDYNLQKSAANGLAALLSVSNRSEEAMVALIRWCCNNIESGDKSESWKNAVPALKQLLKDLASRSLFLQNNGVKSIVSLLNRLKGEKNEGISANPQWIYELSFILWATTLSASNKAELAHFNTSGIVSTLVLLLANSPSRKITRVSVAALNNLAASQDSEILAQMLSANLERVLGNLTSSAVAKHSNDPEFDSDLAQLTENINKNFKDLSSYDRWVAEVNSGTLRWGATHTEKFWRENYKAIEQGDFANLKKIIALINSEDPVVVSVALNDIGEISRFYPNGRLIVARLGGKDAAMAKLSASGNAKVDPDVERYALQCVSKIMVENWENIK